MVFSLSSKNVFEYLIQQGLCTSKDYEPEHIESKSSKNFNLLVMLKDGQKLLVKQESCPQESKTRNEFLNDWKIHQFIYEFKEVSFLKDLSARIVHFDHNHGILVCEYLDKYHDLDDFYTQGNFFPEQIAALIGRNLATIHQSTLNKPQHRDFFCKDLSIPEHYYPDKIMRIGPEVFGSISLDGMKFFVLFQRYGSLREAMIEAIKSFTPCCLVHNDLKPANILLHVDWENNPQASIIRFIDWEFSSWGDPAFDLGSVIANYLKIWLSSLVVSSSISITEALRLSGTPLEYLQPSMVEVIRAYLKQFPAILECEPQFLKQVMRFSGLVLIQKIQTSIREQEPFDNTDICMLQVAKSLLCNPKQSVQTIFGVSESELTGNPVSLAPLTPLAPMAQ
jgi:Phosphotransferase enzyme family